ncbi:hypothetical protein HDV64DRAFT_240926, partial [Trichoderma sp. TUCIM 5745]
MQSHGQDSSKQRQNQLVGPKAAMSSALGLVMSASVIAGLPPGSSAASPHSARARGGWDADPGQDAICGNKSDGMPGGSTKMAMVAVITVTVQHHSRKQVLAANDFCYLGTARAHRWPALPHRGIRIFVNALLLSRHRRSFAARGPEGCSGEDRLWFAIFCRRQMLLRVHMPLHLLARLV